MFTVVTGFAVSVIWAVFDLPRVGPLGWVFFFQAEVGIRDLTVTGVQTCALPIWRAGALPESAGVALRAARRRRRLHAVARRVGAYRRLQYRASLRDRRLDGAARGPTRPPGRRRGKDDRPHGGRLAARAAGRDPGPRDDAAHGREHRLLCPARLLSGIPHRHDDE